MFGSEALAICITSRVLEFQKHFTNNTGLGGIPDD